MPGLDIALLGFKGFNKDVDFALEGFPGPRKDVDFNVRLQTDLYVLQPCLTSCQLGVEESDR